MRAINGWNDLFLMAMWIAVLLMSISLFIVIIWAIFFSSDNEEENDTRRNYGK